MSKHGAHKGKATPSKAKAKEILEHGTVHGRPLTPAQRRFMGARAGGAPVRRGKGK